MAKKDPTIDELLKQAREALEQNDARSARDRLDSVARLEPDHPDLRELTDELAIVKAYIQGIAAIKRVRYDLLAKMLEQWPPPTRASSRYVELRTELENWIEKHRAEGEMYMEQHEWEKAADSWGRVLEVDPENARAKRRLRNCTIAFQGSIAEEFMAEDDWDNAIYKWQEVLRQYPESDEARAGIRRAEAAQRTHHRRKILIGWSIVGTIVGGIVLFFLYWQMSYLPTQQMIRSVENRIRTEMLAENWREATRLADTLRYVTSDSSTVRTWQRRVDAEKTDAERRAAWRDSVMAHEAMAAKVTATLSEVVPAVATPEQQALMDLREMQEKLSTGFVSADSAQDAARRRAVARRRQDSLRAVRQAIIRSTQ